MERVIVILNCSYENENDNLRAVAQKGNTIFSPMSLDHAYTTFNNIQSQTRTHDSVIRLPGCSKRAKLAFPPPSYFFFSKILSNKPTRSKSRDAHEAEER